MALELPVWGGPAVAWWLAALGLVGASVLDRFLDGDDSDGGNDGGGGSDGDDLFGGGGGMSGGGGGMGGGMGGDDGFDDFDGMDEWDDEFDDGGGGGGAGADTDELEKRLDDLEAEVADLSSTVSTVRSENEEISNTVDDIEEDVRNLLDIYEMVTRGINPFVDESSGFDDAPGEAAFGLFDDDEEEADDEELDSSVADADPDGFFDEDLVEPGDDVGGDDFDEVGDDPLGDDPLDDDFDSSDAGDGTPGSDVTADDASDTGSADMEDDMNQDGKSFSELKEEYDAGEADWADEDGVEEEPADDGADPFDDGGMDDGGDDPFGDDGGEDPFGDDGFDEPAGEPEPAAEPAPEPEPARGTTPGGDPTEANHGDGDFEYVGQGDLASGGEKPYLTALPGDYVGDLVVMEWLEFLVAESTVTDAVRAINYYERIDWVAEDAADQLRAFLSGFGTVDRNRVDEPGTDELVREHHTRSLRYITQLNGTTSQALLLDRWDELSSGSMLGGEAPASVGGRAPSEKRRSNGQSTSTRPMNDPAPRTEGADPAAGGWGDGN